MLATLTSKNQITLPKAIIDQIENPKHFDVSLEDGRIVLTPVQIQNPDSIRKKLKELGITEDDISDAIQWSRLNK